MAESLEDRLKSHAKAFDSLLSLIPAKIYYGQDNSDQWQRKKQTKEETRAAKRAKLDPDNAKSAKDVMDENAKKRKREEEGELSEVDGIEAEKPKEGLKRGTKKQKKDERNLDTLKAPADNQSKADELPQDSVTIQKAKAEKRKEKRERTRQKREAINSKAQAKKERKEQGNALKEDAQADFPTDGASGAGSEAVEEEAGGHIDHIDISGMIEPDAITRSTASLSPKYLSPAFDLPISQSGTSSISSIAPPSTTASTTASKPEKAGMAKTLLEFKANPEELKARLQERIDALRAARKADTIDGVPARNRQELLEIRRKKEEQRKVHKKELIRKMREEEMQERELALQRASPLLSPAIMSPATGPNGLSSPLNETSNNFSFGRIAFENGQSMTANLGAMLDPHKRKGPQDPRTALEAAGKRAERLFALDPCKRADIEEKDVWLNAKKRAHGERVRDDTSLLKKTLKRKEQSKRKSEKEWGERLEGVAKGKAFKQKKREENLQKRRDEKGVKGKKKSKSARSKKPMVKARPGFEGSFRTKPGGGSKKK